MRKIPQKIRKQLSESSFMKKCINCGSQNNIEFEHSLIYAGKQINEVYAIQPLCRTCHRGYSGTIKREIKDYSEFIAIVRGLKDLVKKYPKFDWQRRKQELEYKLIRKNLC